MFSKSSLLVLTCLLAATSAFAATITVTNTNDSGAGSLRAALTDATAGDTIDFSLPFPATITVASELRLGALHLRGPGASQLTISGNNAVRVFNRLFDRDGVGTTISGLTIANGNAGGANSGGGILLTDGALTLVDCVLTNNAARSGGAIAASAGSRLNVIDTIISTNTANGGVGGGITTINNGPSIEIYLARCTISGNSARSGGGVAISPNNVLTISNSRINGNTITEGLGGGILNDGFCAMQGGSVDGNQANSTLNGGGISTNGDCTLTEVSVSGNQIGGSGGGISNSGSLTLTRCTVAGNSAAGGANLGGGGIDNLATLTVTNSTISGNSLTSGNSVGAGIFNRNNSSATLTASTIAFNASTSAAGLFAGTNATVTVRSSLIARNTVTSQVAGPDLGGGFVSAGFNLIGNARGSTGFTNGINQDKVGSDGPATINPLLDPLADNGGPTKTHALQLASPAIDSGNPGRGLVTDQRGFPRFTKADVATVLGSSNSDIGAFEFGNTALRITAIARPADGVVTVQGVGLPNALHSVQAAPAVTSTFTTILPAFSDASGNLQFQDNDARSLDERFYRFTYP